MLIQKDVVNRGMVAQIGVCPQGRNCRTWRRRGKCCHHWRTWQWTPYWP